MTHTYDIRDAIYDLANGLYSGLPLCCVLYYIRRNFEARGKPMRQVDLQITGKMNIAVWCEIEEERHGKPYEEIHNEYIRMLKTMSWEKADEYRGPGYSRCDKCYESRDSVEIKMNGLVFRWLYK